MRKSTDSKMRKVTPPSPSYMTNDQFASYLSDLRSNRTTRPGGARPQPAGSRIAPSRPSLARHSLDTPSEADGLDGHQRTPSQAPSLGAHSVSSRYSMSSARSRDYYPTAPSAPLRPSDVVPTTTYMERGQRWMEKEEAFSLRDAMEEMDLRGDTNEPSEEETRIHEAALNEAAELVWQHQNGTSLPRPDGPYRYRPHLRKNSYAHARTASLSRPSDDSLGQESATGFRSVSGSSTDSDGQAPAVGPRIEAEHSGARSSGQRKPYGNVGAISGSVQDRRRSSMKRNISGEIERPFSGDQIWEEPENPPMDSAGSIRSMSPEKFGTKTPNPVNGRRFQFSRPSSEAVKPLSRVEIYRNPPARSRDPMYTTNLNAHTPQGPVLDKSPGVEIRSQDIRDATSLRLKDRSPKLPEPTAVSDSPGRPIVSFDTNWKAPDQSTDNNPDRQAPISSSTRRRQPQLNSVAIPSIAVEEDFTPQPRTSSKPGLPSIYVAAPEDNPPTDPIPTINIPTINIPTINTPTINIPTINIPTINIPTIAVDNTTKRADVPAIVTEDATMTKKNARPLPTPRPSSNRAPNAQRPRGHWSPAPGPLGRATATCHECGFPIEGRFVALAGSSERFHPQCFSCFSCGTSLEAMEISPEPDLVRNERIERIRRREAGETLEDELGKTAVEDGDDRLRFYCHLDWHEFFAPRCKHCKTPILGEHVVALGHHWHNGHFFCAECGDPFQHGMTHIEKDGYAWCINCQTKRTERRAPKCKKCNTAVIGEYVQALGGEWHEQCFRCAACHGGFVDGHIFPKEVEGTTVVLCKTCRAKELKL